MQSWHPMSTQLGACSRETIRNVCMQNTSFLISTHLMSLSPVLHAHLTPASSYANAST